MQKLIPANINEFAVLHFMFLPIILPLSGLIDTDEIMQAFSKMGVHIDRAEAEKLLKRWVIRLHTSYTRIVPLFSTYLSMKCQDEHSSQGYWHT